MRERERDRRRQTLGQALFPLFLAWLSACGAEEAEAELQVLKVVPDYGPGTGSRTHPQRLFLNSQVAVFFTQDLDPLSVTDDTLRLVKLTGEVGIVKLRSVTVHSRSVILEPEPPLTPGLEDGSLQPGQRYRLEIAGLPLTNTVTSLGGRPLLHHEYRYFYTVSATAEETDLPYPLLPVGAPGDVLELRRQPIQMAAASGRLDLHFSMPLVPATVRPEAFEVHCVRRGTAQAERLVLASTLVVSRPQPLDPYPGCSVRLMLEDAEAVQSGDTVYVLVKQEHGIRDYRGRALSGSDGGFRRVSVYEGPKAPLLRLPDRNGAALRFQAKSPDRLSFECVDGREPGVGAWIQPLARREAGYGTLGVFAPKVSTVLEPNRSFELGNGQIQMSGTAFNFQGIHIPKGVTVTVRSRRRVQLRATGAVRIEGVLELETPTPEGRAQLSDLRSPASVCAYAPVTLIAAGSIQVTGSIRQKGQVSGSGPGSPLGVIATRIELQGRVPFHTILGVPERGRVTGPAQSATVVELSMESGLPTDTAMTAEAYTEWRQLPVDFSGSRLPDHLDVRARAEDIQGDLEVFLQVARPDPVDPKRPYLDPSALPRPLPLPAGPLQVPRGAHVRFLLRGQVVGGALPRVRALVVEAD